ncbi:hypothetical protein EV702DRAFT_1278288 [Suillus placidus]|uniref:G domain-containing protein n=1 Tax=Suillus placidus TaxID=48579 RepID=A0A9P7D2L5_9AGAM|nr:hypothetical protein EV702DRAFT_1278288 [Suillus placidus]
MKFSRGDTFSLHVRYKKWYGMKSKHEDIVFEPEDMFRECSAGERREYNKVHKNITVVVELSGNPTAKHTEQLVSPSDETLELQPTTDEMFRKCPQFRILVIGKVGVGKTSLINCAFGVQNAIPAHDMPGEATIDVPLFSPQNNRFVLHDSNGFEPGEKGNLEIVRDFIDRRRAMPDLKDQLHAVWLCFQIPRAGGRLLETGVEQFLTSKLKGELGNVPIVIVFTKYDLLLERVERTLDESAMKSLSKADIQELTETRAKDKLQEICIAPLETLGSGIPHVTVSTNGNHEETLARLIQTTEELVYKHFGTDVSVMTSVAQRVDPGLNIKASIEVGKKKYWNALASGASFKNRSMWDCLHVLHTDIVNVWNFQDTHGVIALFFVVVAYSDVAYAQYLRSPEFRTMMTNMVDELDVGPTADPNKNLAFGLSIVGTVAGIVSALAGPAAPIVAPIMASVVIAKWAYDIYQQSRVALQRFMKYIIDLTLVLQTLYIVLQTPDLVSENREKQGKKELSRRAIKLAVRSYHESPMSGEVHNRIQEYDRDLTFRERADRDSLDQLVQLLQSYNISAEEMPDLRGKIPLWIYHRMNHGTRSRSLSA